jgi:hypothetical protein
MRAIEVTGPDLLYLNRGPSTDHIYAQCWKYFRENAKFETPPRPDRRMAEGPALSLSSNHLLSELSAHFEGKYEGTVAVGMTSRLLSRIPNTEYPFVTGVPILTEKLKASYTSKRRIGRCVSMFSYSLTSFLITFAG